MITFDQATVDSSGAFLIGELERLDQTLNLPLVGYTWTRDIQLREDVSIADDISSWTNYQLRRCGYWCKSEWQKLGRQRLNRYCWRERGYRQIR
ncbi:bacteriophage protein [Escherichia coli]|nr:bacteriophage protein [Escherichia coli]